MVSQPKIERMNSLPSVTVVPRAADNVLLCDGDPTVEVHHDCVYVPLRGGNFWTNKNWGVYDANNYVVDAAAFRNSPGMALVGQNDTCLVNVSDAPYAPVDTYFYVGNVIPHYGHFICSTMTRLWALQRCGGSSLPLLGHAEGDPTHWFTSPVVRSLFGAAGVVLEDFAHFDRPTRIKTLIVPQPAFIERNLCYEAFATAAHGWGDRLAKTQDTSLLHDIVYISKSKYQPNPDGLSNEEEITKELETRDVKIVYPERLSLPSQITLFRTNRVIIGQVGSAFHTAVFSAPIVGQRLINIALSPDVYSSNHALVDLANKNNTLYVYFNGESHPREGANPGFRVEQPRSVALKLLDIARSGS